MTRALRAVVEARRAVFGPLRPSWTPEYETLAEVVRQYARVSTRLPLDLQRSAPRFRPPRKNQIRVPFSPIHAGGVPAAWLDPPGADGVLYYLHGGGYSIGSIESHRELLERLALATGMRVLAIDYRLAPEHRFPAPLEDALAAYRWLLDQTPPERVVIAGESAGGGLTLATLCAARDGGLPLPAAAVCISPWVDLEMGGASIDQNARYDFIQRHVLESYADRYVLRGERRHPHASPLHADLKGLPPLLIQVGGAEALLDDARALAVAARAAEVAVELEVWDDMIHAWHVFAGLLPESQRAIEAVAAFVRRRLSAGRVDRAGSR